MGFQQLWIGRRGELGYTLCSIGGWWCGCECESENIDAVEHAKQRGYIAVRMHYAPMFPFGVPCWELTDAGLERLREIRGEGSAAAAAKMREWYRANARKWTYS